MKYFFIKLCWVALFLCLIVLSIYFFGLSLGNHSYIYLSYFSVGACAIFLVVSLYIIDKVCI